MSVLKNNKKFIGDVVLNIIASAIPQVLLQLLVLPLLAKDVGAEEYGLIVSIVSLTSLVSFVLGNVLNNVRLLYQQDYADMKKEGDFNRILFFLILLNTVILTLVIFFFYSRAFLTIVFSLLASLLILCRNYFLVWFRINLNYKLIAIDSCLLGAGFLAGYCLWKITGQWQIVYILGNGLSCCFILLKRNLLKEPFSKTLLFKKTAKATGILSIASFLENTFNYIDKIILFPMLGGSLVSVYYSASAVGKLATTVFSPVSSVVLSHLSKKKTIGVAVFTKIIVFIFAVSCFAYFATYFVGRLFLFYLYPEWANESMVIFPIAVGIAILMIIDSMVYPFVVKFCNLINQITINAICLLVYLLFCFGLYKMNGIKGFTWGVFITRAVRLVYMLFVFYFENRRHEKYNEDRVLEN